MKLNLFCFAALAILLGYTAPVQAATYDIDFDAAVERQSAEGTFTIDPVSNIDSGFMDFMIKGKTSFTNARGYSWYYSPTIDLSIGGTQVIDDLGLPGSFYVLRLDLTAAALNLLKETRSLNFNILAQDAFWWSDLSPWGGYTKAPFYLDNVSLNITPSVVPLPGAVWLFGSGLIGLVGAAKRRKSLGA